MTIPRPPGALPRPNVAVLRAGTPVHRVHARRRRPVAFNECKGNPTRFAPILDANGRCVPSLYGGSSFIAAVYETIFHDVPAHARWKSVPLNKVTASAHAMLGSRRDIRLASLRTPDLARWRVSRDALIGSSPRWYRDTAAWAKAVHDQFPDVDGLVWTSNRCDPDSAWLFFGDRVRPGDFRVAAVRDGRLDPSLLSDVREAGRRAGITIVV